MQAQLLESAPPSRPRNIAVFGPPPFRPRGIPMDEVEDDFDPDNPLAIVRCVDTLGVSGISNATAATTAGSSSSGLGASGVEGGCGQPVQPGELKPCIVPARLKQFCQHVPPGGSPWMKLKVAKEDVETLRRMITKLTRDNDRLKLELSNEKASVNPRGHERQSSALNLSGTDDTRRRVSSQLPHRFKRSASSPPVEEACVLTETPSGVVSFAEPVGKYVSGFRRLRNHRSNSPGKGRKRFASASVRARSRPRAGGSEDEEGGGRNEEHEGENEEHRARFFKLMHDQRAARLIKKITVGLTPALFSPLCMILILTETRKLLEWICMNHFTVYGHAWFALLAAGTLKPFEGKRPTNRSQGQASC
jgi:hypothetical protein